MTAVSDLAVTVVFQHTVSDEIQFEKIFVIESGKIFRQDSSEAGTREAPVVFVFMTGLQAAYEQIINSAPGQDAEAVNEGCLTERADLPVAFAPAGGDDNLRLFPVIGRIELVGGKELAVSAGHRSHSHYAARGFPDGFQFGAVFGKQDAAVRFFRGNEEAVLSFNGDFGKGVALVQI